MSGLPRYPGSEPIPPSEPVRGSSRRLLLLGITVLVCVLVALAASRPSPEGRKVLDRTGVPGAQGLEAEAEAEEAMTNRARKGRDAQDNSARARLKFAYYLIQNGETDTAAK